MAQPEPEKIRLAKHRGHHAGSIHIHVRGLDLQDIVTTDDIVSALEALPNSHISGLREIRFDPDRETDQSFPAFIPKRISARLKAKYRTWQRAITLYQFDHKKEFFHLLYHEIGHFVYFQIIDSKEKKRWVTEIYPGKGFVSPVASRNAAEDFAESYAFYVLDPGHLAKQHEKNQFMRTNVFKNFMTQPPKVVDIRL